MSRWSAGKRICQMAKELKKQRGGSACVYALDAMHCSYRHQASPENYFVLRFFELTDGEREAYLTSGRSAAADRKLNRFMTGKTIGSCPISDCVTSALQGLYAGKTSMFRKFLFRNFRYFSIAMPKLF